MGIGLPLAGKLVDQPTPPGPALFRSAQLALSADKGACDSRIGEHEQHSEVDAGADALSACIAAAAPPRLYDLTTSVFNLDGTSSPPFFRCPVNRRAGGRT